MTGLKAAQCISIQTAPACPASPTDGMPKPGVSSGSLPGRG